MSNSIFFFTRNVVGDQTEQLTQTVTVYARDEQSARKLLAKDFDRLRAVSKRRERAYARPQRGWNVHEVPLVNEQVLTATTNRL